MYQHKTRKTYSNTDFMSIGNFLLILLLYVVRTHNLTEEVSEEYRYWNLFRSVIV